jgi:hypothetical protein
MKTKLRIVGLSVGLWLIMGFITSLTFLENTAICFSIYTFLLYMYTMGTRINIVELAEFIFSAQLLLMPTITMALYPELMPLPSEEYLTYTLPAVVAVCIGFEVIIFKLPEHSNFIESIDIYLEGKNVIGFMLMGIGIIGTVVAEIAPLSVKHIANQFGNSLYIAVLYGYYSKGKAKYIILTVTISLMLFQTIRSGMFGHLVYWAMLWLAVIGVGKSWATSVKFKVGIILVGFFALLLMQSIKFEYRQATWGDKSGETKSDPELMQRLIAEKITQWDTFFDVDKIFVGFSRLNEGYYLSSAMIHVPHYEPYANGEVLLHFIYPVVPRFIWQDKPITGGAANMSRFTNIINSDTNSTNISPVGEAYVNFGTSWGVLFMFFYGLLFAFFFQFVLKFSIQRPTLVLWLPSLFIGILAVETDILSMWGAFVTSSFFLIIFVQVLRRLNVEL